MTFNYDQQSLYFLIYGFLAWFVQAVYWAARENRFSNHGLLTMPVDYEIGLVYFLIVPVLPTFGRNYAGMYVVVLAALVFVQAVLGAIGARLTKNALWMRNAQDGTRKKVLKALVVALAVLTAYLIIQPAIMNLADIIPPIVLRVTTVLFDIAMAVDFLIVLMAMRRGQEAFDALMSKGRADKLSQRVYQVVWKRLEKAYPGIHNEAEKGKIVFAKGASLDKMVWVFLSCALLGDVLETCYCRLVGGTWMSRSSVIFGPFTFVWGLGAVLLTLALSPLAKKNDRWVFVGGAFLGGAFEYMCSVFTELMFGTVFWDYSYMGALSIGGRTNIPFMVVWGILGVIWVKILYPPLNRTIERMPVVPTKIITWLIVALMAFNGLFTMKVMLRFNDRQAGIPAANRLDSFVDAAYDDDFVRNRWPNMVVVKDEGGITMDERIIALYDAHQIGLTSVANARHMGGYVGADGKVTRIGGVLRTAKLHDLNDEEATILKDQWNLTNVVDFRIEDEVSKAPDRKMDGVENRWISVMGLDKSQVVEALGKPRDEADQIDLMAASAKVVGGLPGLYASLVEQELSHKGYREFFDILLSSEGTVLWHCSEGKDRTGFAAVLLLSALGVDRETILDDYEASNVVYAERWKTLRGTLIERGIPEDEASGIADMMTVNRSAMAAALDLIDTKYGGMDAFLHQQIGLTDEEINALQEKYLE